MTDKTKSTLDELIERLKNFKPSDAVVSPPPFQNYDFPKMHIFETSRKNGDVLFSNYPQYVSEMKKKTNEIQVDNPSE